MGKRREDCLSRLVANLSRIGALLLAVGLVVAVVAVAEAEPRRIVREGAFGCRSLDYLGQIVRAMRQGDEQAVKLGLASGYLSGQCRDFKVGDEVFVMGYKGLDGLVFLRIRLRGELAEFWALDATR